MVSEWRGRGDDEVRLLLQMAHSLTHTHTHTLTHTHTHTHTLTHSHTIAEAAPRAALGDIGNSSKAADTLGAKKGLAARDKNAPEETKADKTSGIGARKCVAFPASTGTVPSRHRLRLSS